MGSVGSSSEAGAMGPLTWRPSGVAEHPGTETGMARNL